MSLNIGTASWTIPRQVAEQFSSEGSALERYAQRFKVAEINSSFHRPHRQSTWKRWRDSVPPDFRFSVKLPKIISHQRKLLDCAELLTEFLDQVAPLGEKLGVLLLQLPPKLAYDNDVAQTFFTQLRARTTISIACEPRHVSWFTAQAETHLTAFEVGRVAADPSICEQAAHPGGWRGLSYWRLHGSPSMYRSSYGERIPLFAKKLHGDLAVGRSTWCIFDNTASSAATADALALVEAVAAVTSRHSGG